MCEMRDERDAREMRERQGARRERDAGTWDRGSPVTLLSERNGHERYLNGMDEEAHPAIRGFCIGDVEPYPPRESWDTLPIVSSPVQLSCGGEIGEILLANRVDIEGVPPYEVIPQQIRAGVNVILGRLEESTTGALITHYFVKVPGDRRTRGFLRQQFSLDHLPLLPLHPRSVSERDAGERMANTVVSLVFRAIDVCVLHSFQCLNGSHCCFFEDPGKMNLNKRP